MTLSAPELEVVAGVRRAYETAVAQFAGAASRGDVQDAERWAAIAFSLVEAIDGRTRQREVARMSDDEFQHVNVKVSTAAADQLEAAVRESLQVVGLRAVDRFALQPETLERDGTHVLEVVSKLAVEAGRRGQALVLLPLVTDGGSMAPIWCVVEKIPEPEVVEDPWP